MDGPGMINFDWSIMASDYRLRVSIAQKCNSGRAYTCTMAEIRCVQCWVFTGGGVLRKIFSIAGGCREIRAGPALGVLTRTENFME